MDEKGLQEKVNLAVLNQDVDIIIPLETEIPITHSSGNPTATLLA